MDVPQALYDEIVQVASDLQLVAYFHVISVVLFIYDYLLTVGMEIDFVWTGPVNILKILYFAQRYLPFFDTCFLVLYRQFLPDPRDDYCRFVYLASNWTFTASIAISEIILSFRVWIVWQRNKVLAVILPLFFVCCWGPAMFVENIELNSVTFGQAPFSYVGCFINGGKPITYLCWSLVLVYEAGLLALMLVSAFRHRDSKSKTGPTSLADIVYRDGIVYYLYLFFLSLANVLIIVFMPGDMGELLCFLERVSYSILTSRVVLHIREHANKIYYQPGDSIVDLYFPDSGIEMSMISPIEEVYRFDRTTRSPLPTSCGSSPFFSESRRSSRSRRTCASCLPTEAEIGVAL